MSGVTESWKGLPVGRRVHNGKVNEFESIKLRDPRGSDYADDSP